MIYGFINATYNTFSAREKGTLINRFIFGAEANVRYDYIELLFILSKLQIIFLWTSKIFYARIYFKYFIFNK